MRELMARIPREIRIVIFGTLGVSVLAVLITVAAVLLSRTSGSGSSRTENIRNQTEILPVGRIDPSEFAIPDERKTSIGSTYSVSRIPREKWSGEEIRKYWTDPAALSAEILAGENRDLALTILEQEGP